jgi:hypothetical protein
MGEMEGPLQTEKPKLEAQAEAMVRTVSDLTIGDNASFTAAGELYKRIAQYEERVGAVMDPIVASAHQAHKTATTARAGLLLPAQQAKRALARKLDEYQQRVESERRRAQEEAFQERQRLEHLERERVAAEQRRLQEEADRKAQDAALRAEQAGDLELADRIASAPAVVPLPPQRPVFVPPTPVEAVPKVAGLSFQERWKADVVDLIALVRAVAGECPTCRCTTAHLAAQPLALVEPNMTALNGMARSLKTAMAVPGVRAVSERIPTSSSSR